MCVSGVVVLLVLPDKWHMNRVGARRYIQAIAIHIRMIVGSDDITIVVKLFVLLV